MTFICGSRSSGTRRTTAITVRAFLSLHAVAQRKMPMHRSLTTQFSNSVLESRIQKPAIQAPSRNAHPLLMS